MNSGKDRTNEADLEGLKLTMNLAIESEEVGLSLSSKNEDLNFYNVYIVTVPTPINQFKAPDLTPLLKASEMIGKVLKEGDIVIYESTVVLDVVHSEFLIMNLNNLKQSLNAIVFDIKSCFVRKRVDERL